MEATNEPRVRINVKQTAKGAVQFDITAETTTPEESAKLLGEAIDKTKQLVSDRGLTLATSE